MTELEKRIEEACKVGASYPSSWNSGYQAGFIKGAKSPEAKAYWQEGMYTNEQMNEACEAGYKNGRSGMYTEEEVYDLIRLFNRSLPEKLQVLPVREWFQRNKKK